MYLHFVWMGILFGFLTGFVESSCYNPPRDLCKSEIPEIHSLKTRDPSYEVNNVTIDWRFCDVYAIDTNKWYKSGSKMSTSCPSVYMCGAKFPIWMNGQNPTFRDGPVNRTSCVRGFEKCCHDIYRLTAINCMKFMAYCFVDLPYGCHQRYCFDNEPKTSSETPKTTRSTYSPKGESLSTSISSQIPTTDHTKGKNYDFLSKYFDSLNVQKNTIGPSTEAKEIHASVVTTSESNYRKLLTVALAGIGLMTATILGLLAIIIRRKRISKVNDKVEKHKTYDRLKPPKVNFIHVDGDDVEHVLHYSI